MTLRWLSWTIGLVVAAASAPPSLVGQADQDPLVIRFLDVGQADAVLVTLGGRAMLIDASGGDDITQVLHEFEIDTLDLLVASHNHQDHIGGMDAVVADFVVRRFYGNGRPPTTAAARNLADWLGQRRIGQGRPSWVPIEFGDARVTIFPSSVGARGSENNASLGVLIERGGFRLLTTGDSERESLGAWLATGRIGPVAVLKAPHHGARDGVNPGWLQRTKPEVVVISVGAVNGHGHPDPLALRYYERGGRRVWRTDRDGTVTIQVNAEGRYQIEALGPTPRDQ